ncbi:hypothetical protein KSP39_PZI009916 [Platanthera zijinensis]|uniref:Uncharacterized protein n=1 Tax=Platanthera zijinensis TaxID=2320716 RepID=A0AAP0G7B5_9ASPA
MAGIGDRKAFAAKRKVEEEEAVEVKIDRPLLELDPVRLKEEIRRWAHAVVRYARQLSRVLSSSSSSSSSRRRSASSSFGTKSDEDAGDSA